MAKQRTRRTVAQMADDNDINDIGCWTHLDETARLMHECQQRMDELKDRYTAVRGRAKRICFRDDGSVTAWTVYCANKGYSVDADADDVLA